MRILYLTHYSIMEPLGQSQILPYLKGLTGLGHAIEIISFEKSSLLKDHGRVEAQRKSLRHCGICWSPRTYHPGSSLPRLLLDIASASLLASKRCRQGSIELIHCRSHVPFLMAWYASALHGLPILFDFRGFMAEEYVDAGLWNKGGLKFRFAKVLERRMSARCAAMVVLTIPMREYVEKTYGLPAEKVFVIPCCVDIARFTPRKPVRQRRPGEPLRVVYSGSTDGRYNVPAMLQFFSHVQKKLPGSRLTILSTGDLGKVQALVAASGLQREVVTVRSVRHDAVPECLWEQDIGLFLLRGEKPTLIAASPTKIGEYLAAGLAVIAERGTGGLEEILVNQGVGDLVDSGDPASWDAAADVAVRMCDQSDHRLRAARTAVRYYSLPEGIETYAKAYEYTVQHPHL